MKNDPNISLLYISRANPAVTLPNTSLVKKAFNSIDFVIGCDVVFTDTMSLCDLVLPATTSLEEEDLIFTSMWHRYINYSQAIVSPVEESRPEWDFFSSLAKIHELNNFPQKKCFSMALFGN